MLAQPLAPGRDLLEPRGWQFALASRETLAARLDEADPLAALDVAAGWPTFLERCARDRFPAAWALKGQTTGPLTLALALVDSGGASLAAACLPALTRWVTRLALAQVTALREHAERVILVLDEPCLGIPHGVPSPVVVAALEEVLSALARAGAVAGVHCCSAPPWGLLQVLPSLALVSFDVVQELDAAQHDPDALALLRRATISWGVVPTVEAGAPLPTARISDLLRSPALITASCGLAGLGELEAERRLAQGAALAQKLRRRAS